MLRGFRRCARSGDRFPRYKSARRVATLIPGFLDLHNETEITQNGIEQILWGHHRFRFPWRRNFSRRCMGCLLF